MKRSLFFVSALLAGMAVSAQDAVNVDLSVVNESMEYVLVAPHTTIATLPVSGIEVQTAFEDEYRCVTVATDGFTEIDFDGVKLIAEEACGLQGAKNPASMLGNPANNYDAPINGAVYTIKAPGNASDFQIVGYFYAFGKISTNRQYWVVMEELGTTIGYEVHMVVGGEAQHWMVNGSGESGVLSDADIHAQFGDILAETDYSGTGIPSLDQMKGYNRGLWLDEWEGRTFNGLGYIKFPVYSGCTYYFGAAGSKFSANAFAFDVEGDAVVALRDKDLPLEALLISPEEEPDEPVGAKGVDYGEVDNVSVDGGSSIATAISAGTVVATGINGLEVGVACDDSYKTVGTNTDDYEAYVFNGTYLNGMTGITGTGSPKVTGGNNPGAFGSYGNAVPVMGCAYTFTAPGNDPNKLVGYFYACGKFSPNKAYWVTEESYAIGYEIDMVVSGKAEHFEVLGDPENRSRLSEESIKAQFTNLPPSIQAAGGWTSTPSLDEMRGYDRNTWPGFANGMGYIKFPVYEGTTYYFGGCGTRFSFSAFYLASGDEEVKVYLRDNDDELDDLLLTPEYEPEEPVSVNVPDYGGVDQALVDATGIALPAGTVVSLGEKAGYEVKVACDDVYRTTGADTDGYDVYVFNGTELPIDAGIIGNANPRTVDGRNMGYIEDYDNAVPASGCAYAFTMPGNPLSGAFVGYLYACGKLSINKSYWVTEECWAIGYEIDMVNGGNVERFAVKGDPYNYLSQEIINAQFTNLPPSVQAAGGWTSTPSLDEMRGYDRNTWPGSNTGMGYIKFPVYEGMTYYFGACGAKFPFSAFYLSSGNERVTVLLRDSAGDLADLLLSGEEPTSITPHDAMEVVQEEYYTVSGIRVPALAPGLNLVRQVLSDGSVRTVKVVR